MYVVVTPILASIWNIALSGIVIIARNEPNKIECKCHKDWIVPKLYLADPFPAAQQFCPSESS